MIINIQKISCSLWSLKIQDCLFLKNLVEFLDLAKGYMLNAVYKKILKLRNLYK